MKKSITRKLCAVTLAAGFALASFGVPGAMAKDRGNSGLPPGPGNPIAKVYQELQELEGRVDDLQQAITTLAPVEADLWIDHIGLRSGDPTVTDALHDGMGGLNFTAISSGPSVLATGLQVPAGFDVQKVIVCYQTSGTASVSGVEVKQFLTATSTVTTPINSALTLMAGSCYDSAAAASNIDPSAGPLTVNINTNYSALNDQITILGLAVHLVPKP